MKSLQIRKWMVMFALGAIFWSCNLIYSDLDKCPQGVYVSFYSMTPCAVDSTFVGGVSSLTVFAFDQEGKLVTSVQQPEVNLDRAFKIFIPVSNGNYSFIAWANVGSKFQRSTFTTGKTTKKDVMFNLQSVNNSAARLNSTERIWQGESPVVSLPDPAEYGSVYEYTSINLQEQTNRIKIIVEFDKPTMKNYDPQHLGIAVSSANGTVNIDGSMPLNSPVLSYPSINTAYTESSATWDFSMLGLTTGHHNNLKITYTDNNDNEEVVFDGDLIAGILLRTVEGGVNLDCEHDFTIKFIIKDYCSECWTHFSCAIYVNNWLVNSYSTEL